jgi:cytochrome b involved in lipid metabolism
MLRVISTRLTQHFNKIKTQTTRFVSAVNNPVKKANDSRDKYNQSGYSSHFLKNVLFVSAGLSLTAAFADCENKENSQAVHEQKKDDKSWKVITRKEVEKHHSFEKGIWVTYEDSVYDVTHFISNHPGGKDKLMEVAGKDIASKWAIYAHHKTSLLVSDLLKEMKIGILPKEDIIIPPKTEYQQKYSNNEIYDVIIVGAGLSGLQCGWSLVNQYNLPPKKILILEAQDYIGGRVKQVTEFVKGAKIEVGAEFLHGNNTELTKFARRNNEPLREIYCWAHGDGGKSVVCHCSSSSSYCCSRLFSFCLVHSSRCFSLSLLLLLSSSLFCSQALYQSRLIMDLVYIILEKIVILIVKMLIVFQGIIKLPKKKRF